MELKCEICGKVFTHNEERYCQANLTRHIKSDHKMEIYDYIVKYKYNNEPPLCACGCGNPVKLNKGWNMNKYFSDSHVIKSKESLEKSKQIRKETFEPSKYYSEKYDINIFIKSLEDFRTKEYSLIDLSKKYQLDKRTIKGAWFKLNLISIDEFNEIANYTKYKLSALKKVENNSNSSSVYAYLYNLVKMYPGKYNKHSMVTYYNLNNIEKITKTPDSIFKDMYRLYGDDFVICLHSGYHSKEEYDFYTILKFYFPQIKIEFGKKIEHEKGYSIFDICIGDKLLIEYDSDGTYHQDDYQLGNDEYKNNLIENMKYDLMRINKNMVKDINLITKIKKYCDDNIYGNNINRI